MPRLHYIALMFVAVHTLAAQEVSVRLDSARAEASITVGPLSVPAATPYNHHFAQPPIEFTWAASGWVRGFRVELVDSTGRALPREMLHHAGITNLDRRQLAYPVAERLVAAGRETEAVSLPGSFGTPLVGGQRLLLYYALANPTDRPVTGATLRITMSWAAEGAQMRTVMPIYFDAHPTLGGASTFDVAPGRSAISAEFTLPVGGHLRYLGGHLHDYGVELRLEDAASNRVLARLAAERNRDGTIRGVARTRFPLKWNGLRLEADHLYRVVAVYDNPSCDPVGGAMGLLVAVFAPDDMRRWPAVDTTDASYQKDLVWLRDTNGGDVGEAHRHGADELTTADSVRAAPSCSSDRRRSGDTSVSS